MNIGQIKLLSWLAAGLLTAGLAFYVYTFVKGFPSLQRPVDTKKIDEVLQQGEPVATKTDDLTSYDDIRRLILPMCDKCKSNPNCKHFNWTGKVTVVEVATTEGPKVAPIKPVKDFLVVQMTAAAADPKASLVSIRYKPEAQVTTKSPTGCFTLHVGDKLHAPIGYVKVDSINDDGVVFAFDDAARAKETIGPKEFDAKTSVMVVDPRNGVIMPKLSSAIVKGETQAWNPERTSPLGNGRYQLGSEDAKEFERDYDRILANELRPERHKDPRTGKYDGIELKSVAPGSIAERHGAQSGDVIKSINGQPVTSPSEAVQFVKNHKDEYTTWEVVVENKGRSRTLVYHSPSH